MMRAHPAFEHPRYEAREELGRGAQGVVVRAVDREAPEAPLCAKVLRAGAFREEALAGEFALLSRARIPGLARAHDLARCTRTGSPFLVEDFIDGPEAGAWVGAASSASARAGRLAKVLDDVTATLALLHDAGFVHGDLKPAHVRVATADGATRAVLLDLGAAVARGGESAFTPAFAAPEVAAGARATALADLYGLGALAWAIATGRPPDRGGARLSLRSRAAWVPPAVADVVEALLADHPRDRPADAREVLRQLGAAQSAAGLPVARPPAPVGRERELAMLLDPNGSSMSAVRYLVGPSGSGKSHLARELVTRALLAGRRARLVRFPAASGTLLAGVLAFLRGNEVALPFLEAEGEAPLLLVMDDVHLAPAEIRAALELYRCRARAELRVHVIAAMREAPDGAEVIALGPLEDAGFAALCRALGMHDDTAIEKARIASNKNPGWLVASAGAVPLTRDTALDRLRGLSATATELLATIALLGGEAAETFCAALTDGHARTELLAAALIDRRGGERTTYTLTAPALAADLAATLATFTRIDRAADVLLAEPEATVAALLALAGAPHPPSRRAELLHRAATAARAEGRSAEELDALFALAADPAARTPESPVAPGAARA
ncbi:MAG: protein kinase [Minicystis sp.]